LPVAQGAKIQLLDLPGIIEGAKDGKGRGKQAGPKHPSACHWVNCDDSQVISVAYSCSLILIAEALID